MNGRSGQRALTDVISLWYPHGRQTLVFPPTAAPGDAVYGLVVLRSGTFAEYTTAKAHELTHKPTSLDYIHAAALPLPSMAAWQSLFG